MLIPGLGLDARSSARLRERLSATVVHLPGMGLAKPVPSLDELAKLVRKGWGEGPVVLVGHSQSCQVVALAALDPRVTEVVLLGPTTDPRLRSVAGLAGRWLRTVLAEPWWQFPRVVAQWSRTGPRAMRALWRAAAPDPIDQRLRAVRVPVTVVRGTRDRLCDGDWARRLVAAAPEGRLVEIPGAAHMLPLTRPTEIAELIRAL